ncbi:UPF0711 protein C18orf21 homolog isoform X2 [Limulus polyphemus]|uniref:UPF0711 protein C18orf21 homolog isoform X2 n=1 Tax=Limulus polyphemus TaxID=6850 RepID=A0ABM1C4S1_LIMPO|nr:UPF0711 protein C18orf21 homolog isoform X2 [Limulus polyphemus]
MDTDAHVVKKDVKHLLNAGTFALAFSPVISRLYFYKFQEFLNKEQKKEQKKNEHICPHCGSAWLPGNHRVRIKPRPKLTKHLRKLLKKGRDNSESIKLKDRRQIDYFRKSTNKIIVHCLSCKKATSREGGRKPVIPQHFLERRQICSMSYSKKSKRKRKDINAGLNLSSLSPHERKSTLLTPDGQISSYLSTSILSLDSSPSPKLSRPSISSSETSHGNIATPKSDSEAQSKAWSSFSNSSPTPVKSDYLTLKKRKISICFYKRFSKENVERQKVEGT